MSRHSVSDQRIDLTFCSLPDDVIVERDVGVVMRDGIRLSVNVFRPRKAGRYPVVMAVSPYGKDQFAQMEMFRQVPGVHLGRITISDHTAFEAPDPGFWVPNGYVVVQGDTRGQGLSQGDTGPFHQQDREDYYDLIEWAGTQPWNDGNVGLSGVSYLTVSQWSVASLRPPHLKAIVPWEGWNDYYRRFHFGGIPETGFMAFVWNLEIVPNHNTACGYIQPDYLEAARQHPLLDDYWKGMDYGLERIEVPALVCASFSDQGLHTRDTFEGFKRISSSQKWLYNHRRPKWDAYYREDALALQKQFFDQFLKGQDGAMADVPKVRIEVNETRDKLKVIQAREWPIEGTDYVPLFLNAQNASLSRQVPTQSSHHAYTPNDEGRATYDFTFAEDTDLIGNTKLKLWVSAENADDMDLFVGLRKFDAEGEEVFFCGFSGINPNDVVSRGWLRVSHRELDEQRSKPWQPFHKHERLLKLQPNQVVPVDIEILPAGVTFRKGETLRLVVQGTRLTPDAALLGFDDVINRGRHVIHTGGRFDSHLLLPIVRNAPVVP